VATRRSSAVAVAEIVAATVETVVAAVDAAETADTIAINHSDFLRTFQSLALFCQAFFIVKFYTQQKMH
jgi:hypothetical protein